MSYPSITNQLFYGDNLQILRQFIPEKIIDLCYIDPPFYSQRNYYQTTTENGITLKVKAFTDTWKWNNQAAEEYNQILENLSNIFSQQTQDIIVGFSKIIGKNSLFAYIVSLTIRLGEIHRILKPTGSLYLHCNASASHYLKIILDTIFCPQGGKFQNEIIWCYTLGGKSKRRFAKKHDTIFFYTKNATQYTFNSEAATIPRKPSSHMKTKTDETGRKYQQKTDPKTQKTYQYYLDEGKIAEDYWTDIETLNRKDKQRQGYPTQKPQALLERIIKVSSNQGDIILDAYCGAGTTLVAAQKLNRHWIGIDKTPQSLSLTLERLTEIFGPQIINQIEILNHPKKNQTSID
ncbi:MAG TPA: site-specific DNA-methyltransferase [Halomicronema sp.]